MRCLRTGVSLALALGVLASALGQSYFSDFNDGIAHGWLFDQGQWSVQRTGSQGVLAGTGVYVNGRVFNVGYVDQFVGRDMSVQALLHTDANRGDDVSHMLILRYVDPLNFVSVNFRGGFRQDIVVENVVNGQRSYVVPEFENTIPQIGQTDFHLVRADMMGNHLVAWVDGQMVFDRNITGLYMVAGSPGTACFGSPGGQEQVYCDNFLAAFARLVSVSSHTIDYGRYLSGDDTTFNGTPGNYFVVGNLPAVSLTTPVLRMRTSYTVPLSGLVEMTLRYTGHTSIPGLRQVLEMLNQTTGTWEEIDSRLTSAGDRSVRALISGDPNRFIQPGTRSASVRYSLYEVAPPAISNYRAYINELRLHVVSQ